MQTIVAITMNIMMKRRKRSIKRFVLDEQEDEETNELLNNGTSRIIEFTNSDSPLIAKFGEQIFAGEFIKLFTHIIRLDYK